MEDNYIFIGSKYLSTILWNHKYLLHKQDIRRRHIEMRAISKIHLLLKN